MHFPASDVLHVFDGFVLCTQHRQYTDFAGFVGVPYLRQEMVAVHYVIYGYGDCFSSFLYHFIIYILLSTGQ